MELKYGAGMGYWVWEGSSQTRNKKIIQNWGCRRVAKENSQGKYGMVSVKEILMYFKVVKGISGTR